MKFELKNIFLCYLLLFAAQTLTAQTKVIPQKNPWFNKTMVAKRNAQLKENLVTSKVNSVEADHGSTIMNQLPPDARFAAQFEENQAIIMTWAYNQVFDSSFNVINLGIYADTLYGKISCDLADAIQRNAMVVIRVVSFADTTAILQVMANRGTPLYNYRFYEQASDSWWDRDSGPVCFYFTDQDSIGILDMDYYVYAAIKLDDSTVYTDYNLINEYNRIHDDSIPIAIGKEFGYPVYKTPINNEGGNLIFDGLGATWTSTRTREQNVGSDYLIIFDPVTFQISYDSSITTYENYPALNDSEYEQLITDSYKTNYFVEPLTLDCDGGTGHLDIYLKLFDDNKLGIVDYSHAPGHSDYEDWSMNADALKIAKDNNDKPFDISILPMPLTDGDVPQSECEIDQRTYINGIFVNKSYIMPVQSDPATGLAPFDQAAVESFRKALPGYTIIPIDSRLMYGTGGALHCITHEIPAENPIFIRHKALTGAQPQQNTFPLTAEVKNKSGIANAKAYFRKAGQTQWQSVNLTASTANNFNFTLPGNGFANTDTIEYFIEAISNNGKTITKPFTAREGGYWRFHFSNSVATTNPDQVSMEVFPNPSFDGLFQLTGVNHITSQSDIAVSNLIGQTILLQKASNSTIDLRAQPAGVYFVNIKHNGILQVLKLVKS
jgi:agmatine/peptidylarginine deiminase